MLQFLRKTDDNSRLGALRQLFLFSTLSHSQLRIVAGLLHERRYMGGEIIFDEGERGEALYIIVSGRVLVCSQGEPVAERIAELDPGVVFGELALLGNMRRARQTRALEDCVVASLAGSDFASLLDTHTAIAAQIALQLARQLGRQLAQRSGNNNLAPL